MDKLLNGKLLRIERELKKRIEKLEAVSHPPVPKKYDPELAYAVQIRLLKANEALLKRVETLEKKVNAPICDECGSQYFKESSPDMASLCPECAHQLYGYVNCGHEYMNGRCTECYWDGSVSTATYNGEDSDDDNLSEDDDDA